MTTGDWISIVGMILGMFGTGVAIFVRVNTTLKGLEMRVCALEKEFENMSDIKEQIAGIKPVLEQVKEDNRSIKHAIDSLNKDLRDYFTRKS